MDKVVDILDYLIENVNDGHFSTIYNTYKRNIIDYCHVHLQDEINAEDIDQEQIIEDFYKIKPEIDKHLSASITNVLAHIKELKHHIKDYELSEISYNILSEAEAHSLLILLTYPENVIIEKLLYECDISKTNQIRRNDIKSRKFFVMFNLLYTLSYIKSQISYDMNEYLDSNLLHACTQIAVSAVQPVSPLLNTTLNKVSIYNICPTTYLKGITTKLQLKKNIKSSKFKM